MSAACWCPLLLFTQTAGPCSQAPCCCSLKQQAPAHEHPVAIDAPAAFHVLSHSLSTSTTLSHHHSVLCPHPACVQKVHRCS
eukprot:469147-Pelagomonas_calceolata.AAC.2